MELAPDGRQSETALRIGRGVRRLLARLGFASLPEVPLRSGRRADLLAVNGRGEVWIIEIKSSVADFRADTKWSDYLAHCDRFFFATTLEVPPDLFPETTGLIIADAFGAETMREAPLRPLAAGTRKEVLIRLALAGAGRMHALADPEWSGHSL